jgi:hypothetical protein
MQLWLDETGESQEATPTEQEGIQRPVGYNPAPGWVLSGFLTVEDQAVERMIGVSDGLLNPLANK